jgi:RNA polymerase sigma-70 factor (ECF subfamily)
LESIVALEEDAALMRAVAGGDRAAFARLFDRHQAAVVRLCVRLVGDAAVAEELAQDIFVKVYRSADRYQPTARFTTWLFRIATNHCLNELRRPARRSEQVAAGGDEEEAGPSVLEAAPGGATPIEALEAREVEAAVGRALLAMSDRERAAFSLCRFEGLPYREVAEALEATEAAVKSLIHRASVRVVQHLEALGESPASLPGVSHG